MENIKKILLLILILLTIIIIKNCGTEGKFFKEKDLIEFGLSDFPVLNFSKSKIIKKSNGALDGYFVIEKNEFDAYAFDIYNYLKESSYEYGGLLFADVSSLSGMFNRYNYYTFKNFDFYQSKENGYNFGYKIDDSNDKYIIHFEYGEFRNNKYNANLFIRKTGSLKEHIDDVYYSEVELTKLDIIERDLLKISFIEEDRSSVKLEFNFDKDMVQEDMDILVKVSLKGKEQIIEFASYPYHRESRLFYFFHSEDELNEDDLVILDIIVNKFLVLIRNEIDEGESYGME